MNSFLPPGLQFRIKMINVVIGRISEQKVKDAFATQIEPLNQSARNWGKMNKTWLDYIFKDQNIDVYNIFRNSFKTMKILNSILDMYKIT